MRDALHTILSWMAAFGVEPAKTLTALRNLPTTLKEHVELRRQNAQLKDRWPIFLRSPNFIDRHDVGGIASGHYFHQDLFVARKIYVRNPDKHVDIGSRIDGFVAHVAVFREIEVFDIRALNSKVENILFRQLDLMESDTNLTNYCDSISCLHALEHFGLGRYGDAVAADGYEQGFHQLSRMLRKGGIMYLSVPIGKERIEFNGQRVFSVNRLLDMFNDDFSLLAFSYIDDEGDLHSEIKLSDVNVNNLTNGCGVFELQKKANH